jgi:predicted secreted hydrolase
MTARPWRALVLVAILASGCGTPILANPPQSFPAPAVAPTPPPQPPDPIPLAFPRDDGPHRRLTEWWYYTGHLRTEDGRRFGFEAVVFRAERSTVPIAWASHLALTDEAGSTFHYAQRSEIGPQVDQSPRDAAGQPIGFDLRVGGTSGAPWRLSGGESLHAIEARLQPAEAAVAGRSFGLRLTLAGKAEPVPHDDDGFVDFGPAGTSYYYSRTRMLATGELHLDGEEVEVSGIAWFDHQWGDFVSVGGGWDWFAINLDDAQGTDVTISVVRDAAGTPVLEYGTLVRSGTRPVRLGPADFELETLGSWTSPRTGRTWPAGWRVTMGELVIELEPTVADQELDTRATTGVVYWEGSQIVRATRGGVPINGEAYVEITRYGE